MQREKGKETILTQINVRNTAQILYLLWEDVGKGRKLINQVPLILPKVKHFCTFGTDTPPLVQISHLIHYLLPIPSGILFRQVFHPLLL